MFGVNIFRKAFKINCDEWEAELKRSGGWDIGTSYRVLSWLKLVIYRKIVAGNYNNRNKHAREGFASATRTTNQ